MNKSINLSTVNWNLSAINNFCMINDTDYNCDEEEITLIEVIQ